MVIVDFLKYLMLLLLKTITILPLGDQYSETKDNKEKTAISSKATLTVLWPFKQRNRSMVSCWHCCWWWCVDCCQQHQSSTIRPKYPTAGCCCTRLCTYYLMQQNSAADSSSLVLKALNFWRLRNWKLPKFVKFWWRHQGTSTQEQQQQNLILKTD